MGASPCQKQRAPSASTAESNPRNSTTREQATRNVAPSARGKRKNNPTPNKKGKRGNERNTSFPPPIRHRQKPRACGDHAMTDPRYMRPGLNFARAKTIEELGELQAALGKSLRWGWDSHNPELPPDQRESNEAWVKREMADVRDALDNLEHELMKRLG